MRKVAAVLGFIFAALLVSSWAPASAQTRKPAATKFDEFGKVGHCDQLANTHKIGADRFIVVFAPAGESESSQLSLWIVPKGQPLPDPNESEDDSEKRP